MKKTMKALLFLMFLSIATGLQAQNGIVEMTPYDMKTDPVGVYDDLKASKVPEAIFCRYETCPEKLKAKGVNIFMVKTADSPSKIKVSKKLLRKLKKKKKLFGVYENGKLNIYKKGKGLLKRRGRKK